MSALAELTNELGPDWLVGEMPPGYRNRLDEIQRLSADLRAMSRHGRLLWQVGDELTEAVRDVFAALRFEADLASTAASSVNVKIDSRRRLLIHVAETTGTIQKKDPALAHVFHMLHEQADDADRVVLVVNSDPGTRPADRLEPMGPEALNLLSRMGANVLPAPTLFVLWSMSLQDHDRARSYVERLHGQDGGTFVLPSLGAS